MKKILVIGSTVVDMIVNVDKLPTSKADIHIKSQRANMGGCAFNVYDIIDKFGCPNILFSPVGGGIYGGFVRNYFESNNISTPISNVKGDNGCCYCFVEESGERTFVSYHGAEYLIHREWLDTIDSEEIHSAYICGLEIEEKTGEDIVSWLEDNRNFPVYFAPGPRMTRIDKSLLRRLFDVGVIVHLNEDEIAEYAGTGDLKRAMRELNRKTHNTVIVTTGEKGACWYDGENFYTARPVKAETVADTIGAGDSHIGAVMACLYKGMSMQKAVETANKVASRVVQTHGAQLSAEEFSAVFAD